MFASSLLIILVVASAVLHILAEYRGPRWQVYLFKPLTTGLILVVAVLGQGASPGYKILLVTGLLFSLAGDIFLMLPADRFLPGLAAFLTAHGFYIAAFLPGALPLRWWPAVPLILYGLLVYRYLESGTGSMRLPVIGYMVIILFMTWLAGERWLGGGGADTLQAAVGAVLFLLSDTLLAAGRFREGFPALRALSLGSYFAAQLLIAGSAGFLFL
jgi:uncharacterized membrane protein YhhN